MIRGTNYRYIPLSTRISILFGGFKNQFGWFFFGFGMIFFWAFAMNADLSFIYYRGEIIEAEGVTTSWESTNASEGEVTVYATYFIFDADGSKYEGKSYATGEYLAQNEAVIIEYPDGKPEFARIKGMRTHMFHGVAIWVVMFPLVGLIFILFGKRRSFRALKLFRHGEISTGVLISKEKTNTTINKRPVYRMTFSYKDEDGVEYIRKERSHIPHLLEDQREERLLYLRSRPSCSIMLDSLPSSNLMDAKGNMQAASRGRAFMLLLIPLATLIGHGIYFVDTYLISNPVNAW